MMSFGRLDPTRVFFVMVDMQSCFGAVQPEFRSVIQAAHKLLTVANLLSLNVLTTEQYPEKLRGTMPELLSELKSPPIPKTSFSILESPQVVAQIEGFHKECPQVVLFGFETHICILQSALDLLERGFEVHIVCNAVGSRHPDDKHIAIERLKMAGAFLTTFEIVIFDLLRSKDHPLFKTVQALIKQDSIPILCESSANLSPSVASTTSS